MFSILRTAFTLIFFACTCHTGLATAPPNVLVILSDDQGWGDVGFNGCTDIPTPHLDALAADGVRCSQGYASHPYCSPSRAGLLAGRHQQRFGHENNTPYLNPTDQDGLPLDEEILSETLSKAGYQTAMVGKWHLGDHPTFWPNQRGFDDWFGFHGGGNDYWGNLNNKPATAGVLLNGKPIGRESLTYLTDDFSEAAVDYINRYTRNENPFFMYLAYNAPHAPIQSPKKYLAEVEHIEDGNRAAYAAMVVGMDQGIGRVVAALKAAGVYDNTLIVFYSDNGGHIHSASSAPFRGHKGMLFEGGIRVPFSITWPQVIPAGQTYDKPITALDIFPTVLAATEATAPKKELDGVNLLPYLQGKSDAAPHETLYWRYSDGAGYAVRHGDEKLVYSAYKRKHLLFDLAGDPYEHDDLAESQPERVKALITRYEAWNENNIPGLWQDPHIENVRKEEAKRQHVVDRASQGERSAAK